MIEKRKSPRIPVTLHLSISDLYKEDPIISGLRNLDSPIQLVNLSSEGLAFISECVLPTDYYFNATLKTDDDSTDIITVVKIIHSHAVDQNHYQYGCQFKSIPKSLEKFLHTI